MIKFDFKTFNEYYEENCDLTNFLNKFKEENKMAGWYDLDIDTSLIKKYAESIRENADIFIVIGIGGSYLGAKAVIDAFTPYFSKNKPEIIFLGTSLSSEYITNLLEYIKNKSIYLNVISKSGNTMETLINFEIILDYMKNNFNDFTDRIIVTTNKNNGKLLEYVNNYNFKMLEVPENIGGRFSVLSAVGLLPISVANIDIDKIIMGAKEVKKDLTKVYEYTCIRNKMIEHNKLVESFDIYEPKLYYFTEWLKQLFAESQGKCNNAILPISTVNTRDLHSLGQFYQEGTPMIFSTTIFANSNIDINIDKYGKNMNEINKIVMESVIKAHYPNIYTNIIELDSINEENIGYLIFFFEISCMLGSYIMGINYYDQPGVNKYKENVLDILEN